jgi:methyl-accepting chemotaxis protein
MRQQPDRRHRVLIDDLQYRLLVANIGYFFVILVTFLTALFAPLVLQLLDDGGSLGAKERAAQQFLLLDQTVWLPLLLAFFILAAHSVFVSHRIAGPLVQLRRVLREVGAGDLTNRVTLRKKDSLWREANVLNHTIDELAGSVGELEREARDVQSRLRWLRTSIATGRRGEILDQLSALDGHAQALVGAVDRFTLESDVEAGRPVLVSSNHS